MKSVLAQIIENDERILKAVRIMAKKDPRFKKAMRSLYLGWKEELIRERRLEKKLRRAIVIIDEGGAYNSKPKRKTKGG